MTAYFWDGTLMNLDRDQALTAIEKFMAAGDYASKQSFFVQALGHLSRGQTSGKPTASDAFRLGEINESWAEYLAENPDKPFAIRQQGFFDEAKRNYEEAFAFATATDHEQERELAGRACMAIAALYQRKRLPLDPDRDVPQMVFDYTRQAAETGLVSAQLKLVQYLYDGTGAYKDPQRAVVWMMQARANTHKVPFETALAMLDWLDHVAARDPAGQDLAEIGASFLRRQGQGRVKDSTRDAPTVG